MIVSGLVFGWGQTAGAAHRFVAFDKSNGQTIWVSSPEGRPTDTIYANPYVADVNGVRMFFSGGSDGAMHALKVATGEPVWNWEVSKRGLNTAALMVGPDVIVTHSEENLLTSEMGMIAAVPAASKGTLTDKDARWIVRDVQAGYGSPVSRRPADLPRRQRRHAVRVRREDRQAALEREARHDSEVLAGAGRRQALRRHRERQVLHHPAARRQSGDPRQRSARHRRQPEAIVASPAVARGRIYITTMDAPYAIGPKGTPAAARPSRRAAPGAPAAPGGAPAALLVTPTDLLLKPGEPVALTVRAFDANGNPSAAPAQATWSLEGLKGTVDDGRFTADPAAGAQAGMVKATVGALSGARRGSGSCRRRRGPSTSRTAARCRRRTGSTPPASSRCAMSRAARCWSSWRKTRSPSPSGAGRSSAARSSATTRSSRMSAPSNAAARWGTSASSRSATSWCCSAATSASSCSRGSRKRSEPRGSRSRGPRTPGTR